MVQNKAPSHGTKVDLGKDAPVTEEGPGAVKSASLAAESAKHGGAFAENKGVDIDSSGGGGKYDSENRPAPSENTARSSGGDENTSSSSSRGALSNEAQGGPAPTYVQNQYIRYPGGPHGKNIHEGIDEAEARKAKREDPLAAVERQYVQTEQRAAGREPVRAGEKTAFDALGDAQA